MTTATVDGQPVESLGGLTTCAQQAISDVQLFSYDLLLISGGDGIQTVVNEQSIKWLLQEADKLNIPIASICASAALLGKAGLLEGEKFTCLPSTYDSFRDIFNGAEYTGEDIVVGKNKITAKGTAFPEFTAEVGEMLGIWQDEEQRKRAYRFCKEIS